MRAVNRTWRQAFGFSLLCAAVLLLQFSPLGDFSSRAMYDLGTKFYSGTANNRISVIAIDEKSLAHLGRWPWNREYHAALIEKLSTVSPKVIGYPVFFVEPQRDNRLALLDDILQQPALTELQQQVNAIEQGALKDTLSQRLSGFYLSLLQSRESFDVDALLARHITAAGNVVLPYHLGVGRQLGRADQPLPPSIHKSVMPVRAGADTSVEKMEAIEVIALTPPLQNLVLASKSLGHLVVEPDDDGVVRRSALVVDYYGEYLPSLALQIVAQALNLNPNDVALTPGQSVSIGALEVATDNRGQVANLFYPSASGAPAFSVDSFYDVLVGNVSVDKFRNQIVLVGPTAAGVGATLKTAVDRAMSPVNLLATSVSNIINEDVVTHLTPALVYQLLAYLIVCILLVITSVWLSPLVSAFYCSLGLLGILATMFILLSQHKLWLDLTGSAMLLVLGYLLLNLERLRYSEQSRAKADRDSAEGNRMLGLSFQGQGQLDIAFEKFQRCPLDTDMMQLLYNLGLDFERKRQFSKAAVVYQHMQGFDRRYRDIEKRIAQAQKLEGAIVLGAPSQQGPGASMIVDAKDVEKPMLGRYQVESELGKGAMGIVYKGRDPKIDRVVAIKTMALAQQFEADEIEGVKARFFREAETAGRLSHPNIVTVYDAGSEHDLAYIAMQFLPGYELTKHSRESKLLGWQAVLTLLIQAADALHYAHQNQVVHRDIKPANMIFDPQLHTVVLTDFGIARVTDASKTKTGTVLGTPSYMSPEQFRGEKSDGRADIFSLAVTGYQLLTGELPFRGDSMASLMYAITTEAFAPLSQLSPRLPAALDEIFNKAMAKAREDRYQSAQQFQLALQEVLDAQ